MMTATTEKRQKLYLLLEAVLTGGLSGLKATWERKFLLWHYPEDKL